MSDYTEYTEDDVEIAFDEVLSKPIVEMIPTEDQQLALDKIKAWLAGGGGAGNFFLLRGYAGTGKSFLISQLIKSGMFRTSEVCFTAPTNKAVKVLRNYLDDAGLQACSTRTIYSLLGLSLQPNGEVKELTAPDEDVIDLGQLSLIVVDESSMVNKFLMAEIDRNSKRFDLPIIFMGDPAQLPPVGEISSPVWSIQNSVELTKVLRYGNSILDLATSIRSVVDHPFPSVKIETNEPVYRVGKGTFMEEILNNHEALAAGDAKVIAWRNVTVAKYNALVRGKIFGQAEARANTWLPGDKIVATAQLKDLDDETFMRTDEEGVILELAMGMHPLYTEFEIWNLLIEKEGERKYTLRVLSETGNFHLNNKLAELSMEAKSGKRYKWREFWQLKEAFHEIKHSYSITTHRSQGSSYLKVFVDLEDIMLNRNRPEAFRSLYVACTRAREEVWLS